MPPNYEYEPTSPNEEAIIDVLRGSGPLRPTHIAEQTGKTMSANNHYLRRLVAAGWVQSPNEGLYELVCDPREMADEDLAEILREHADRLDPEH